MSRIMFIDGSHREQIRVAVTEKGRVTEFDIESFDKKQTIGNIYLAKVTRVEPSLQAAFVEYGSGKQGFLPFAEIHPDYYQIPLEDRKRILEEAAAFYNTQDDDADDLDLDLDTDNTTDDNLIDDVHHHHIDTHTDTLSDDLSDVLDIQDISAYHVKQDTFTHTDSTIEETALSEASEKENNENLSEDDNSVINTPKPTTQKPYVRKPRLPRYKIQEVIKKRQILLVQVIKSERGNKGASLTTYLSLAGRYCVLMPNTARGGGISRKITNVADRQKLRSTIKEFELPAGMGLIIRTAGLQRTKTDLHRDYEYLLRLWDNVRQLTMASTAPSLVYEEGDLIKRTLRDVYSRDTGKIFVQGEESFKETRDIMKMIMPANVRYVHHYRDPVPLFSRYQIERQLDELSSPQVHLKSGGYLVINHTEALIAIDVNSGKSTSSYSIEETALRTNLEAAEEIARQLRLRDLAGLIVIDFIDMEDYGNVRHVERKMRDFLRHDKARLQTAPISTFGLMEMTRQRLRPAMKDLMSVPCDHCQGMGFVLSLETSALRVLRAVFEEIAQKPIAEVSVNCTIDIAHYLLNKKRKELLAVEQEYDLTIHINGLSKYARLEYDIETVLKDPTKIIKIPKAYQEEDYEEQPIETDISDSDYILAPSDDIITEESHPASRSRRSRDNKRRNQNRRGDKSESLDISHSNVSVDISETVTKTENKNRHPRHNEKRSIFNRKRGRFDVQLSEKPELFITASGNEVVIENRVSVYNIETSLPIYDISTQEISPCHNTTYVETVPEKTVDNMVIDTQAQTKNIHKAYNATYTVPSEYDGEVLTHLDTRPIEQIVPETIVHADKEALDTAKHEHTDILIHQISATQAVSSNILPETLVDNTIETPEQKSARRGWWRNRFGL